MPMPRLLAKINKHTFNKRAINQSEKWTTVTHIGRNSGATYRTPLDGYEIDGGYIFILVYGSKSDWVQNVLDAGTAQIQTTDGRHLEASNPRLISESDAWPLLPKDTKKPAGLFNVHEFLQVDTSV